MTRFTLARDTGGHYWQCIRYDGDPVTDSISRVRSRESWEGWLASHGIEAQPGGDGPWEHWGGPMVPGPGRVQVLARARGVIE